jgi:hypothetical protein
VKLSKQVLAACVTLSMATACGSSSSSGGGSGIQDLVQGTWASACMGGGSASEKSVLVISGSTFASTLTSYANGTCTGTGTPTSNGSGTFALGAGVSAAMGSATVTAYPVDSTQSGQLNYSLLYVETGVTPNKLYDGLYTVTLDGSTAAKRPVAIDPSSPMTRQ